MTSRQAGWRLVGFLASGLSILIVLWYVEDRWLEAKPTARRALKANTYLTAADVMGSHPELVGKFLISTKERRAVIESTDVSPTPSAPKGSVVLMLLFSPERSLGPILVAGMCADLWNAGDGTRVGDGLKVVAVLPAAPDGKRFVYLAAPPAKAGAIVKVKDAVLTVGTSCPKG